MIEPWSAVISEIRLKSWVWFCLYFHKPASPTRATYLAIESPCSYVSAENQDFTGSGKLVGCEKYLVGQNNKQELVIYHFDR